MSDVNPDPTSGAYYQASDGRWYPFDQGPTAATAATGPTSNPAGARLAPTDLADPAGVLNAARSLHGLASFFTFLGWAAVILGIIAGIAMAADGSSSNDYYSDSGSDAEVIAGLVTGAAIMISGLWMVLLSKATDTFARYVTYRARS